jgi:hypothetical protein
VGIVEYLGTRRLDPLGIQKRLPLTGTFYPLGFRLDIATNSPDVIEAAREAWAAQAPEFDAPPLTMRVVVEPGGPLSQQATHTKQGHLYSIVSDPQNFAHVDLDTNFAFIRITQATASDHSWLRWFFIESLAYMMLCQRHVVMVHAGCVARNGSGVLLCGPSTAGKSTLSYACARAGWTWIADDCTCLLPDSTDRTAIGRSRHARFRLDAPQLFPELARARPTGKIGIEVPLGDLPHIRTANSAPIGALAFLDRGPGPPALRRISPEEALDLVLADMPCYGPEVDALHERAVRRLVEAPAYRINYQSVDDGIALLGEIYQ